MASGLARSKIVHLLAGLACTVVVACVAAALAYQLAQRPGRASGAVPPSARAAALERAPCGFRHERAPAIRHVVWIWFANEFRNTVLGSPAAPFMNVLAAECGIDIHYSSLGQPSLVDYLGAITGRRPGFRHPCAACTVRGPTLLGRVRSWRAYYGGMAAPCQRRNSAAYVRTHNAATFVPRLAAKCARDDLPLGSTPSRSRLVRAAEAGTLPAFTLIVPGQCTNMHFDSACPTGERPPRRRSTYISMGDDWLKTWLSPILRSASYRDGSTAVFITWDEGTPAPAGSGGISCPPGSQQPACGVALIGVSPYTPPGTVTDMHGSHFALLKLTERLLGVRAPGGAFSASTPDLGSGFGL